MRPDRVIDHLLAGDPARPRVTFYDDSTGPTKGERIELSGKVLANWVNKAANLLQEELDAGPGTRVRLDLPAAHWRTVYWAFAVWAVGATVVTDGDADLRIADTAPADVVVTLAALSRQHTGDLGGGVDEAKELATFADRFSAWDGADDDAPALVAADRSWTYTSLVEQAEPGRELVSGPLSDTLRRVAALFAGDGAVLLVRDPDSAAMPARLRAEGIGD